MSRKKNDKAVFNVEKALSDALISLMNEKQYSDIRIIEICDRAMLARCTFYRHFNDKDELLTHSCKEVFHGLSERLMQENCRTFYGMSIGFFSYWQSQKAFLSIFQKSGMLGFLSWHFEELMMGVAREVKPENAEMKVSDYSAKVKYHYFFGMGGFWQMAIRWFMAGCRETPEELAQYVVAYLVESFEMEPDCQYYSKNGKYPYEPCFIKPGNEL